MTKKIICIECPKGCSLIVDLEGCKVKSVDGAECPKGEKYAIAEIENPTRVLTSTILTEGLDLKLIPVRTNKPIPRKRMLEAAEALKKLKIKTPPAIGDVIIEDFLGMGVDIIATRTAPF